MPSTINQGSNVAQLRKPHMGIFDANTRPADTGRIWSRAPQTTSARHVTDWVSDD